MLETSQQDIRNYLRSCIQEIKRQRPNLSSSALASQLAIAGSTFGRIENAEVRKPDFGHAFTIVNAAFGEAVARDFVSTHYPDIVKTLSSFTPPTPPSSDIVYIGQEASQYFADSASYELMIRTCCRPGLSRAEAQYHYGLRGVAILEQLTEKGVLRFDGDCYHVGANVDFDQAAVKSLAGRLLENHYDLTGFGSEKSWLSLQVEAVNRAKVAPAIARVMKHAFQEIHRIMEDPANAGTDVVWTVLATDDIDKSPHSAEHIQ